MEVKKRYTDRGFQIIEFKDSYGQECSLQESSRVSPPSIWLGVDNTGPELKGPGDKYNSPVSIRMHLTDKQVKELITHLKHFVKKDELFSRGFDDAGSGI